MKNVTLPDQVCQVFQADDMVVTIGVNMDDGLFGPEDVCLGDIYELMQDARAQKLILNRSGNSQTVAEGSSIGVPHSSVTLIARYTMMASDGERVELLALRLEQDGSYWVLPLSPIGMGIDYTLLKMEAPQPSERLLDLLCISFGRGTLITLGNGAQRPIEDLSVGDRILTRDHGPQELRWLGKVTLRAVGAYAPVVIPAGEIENAGDLIISQHHRVFRYLRHRGGDVAKPEVLVQAKHLVDGERIFIREGGYVDYFSLVFDSHEVIYAEGIPAESLLVTEATVSRLPSDLAAEVQARFPGVSQNQHFGIEAGPQVVAALRHDVAKRRRGTP
ncbi:Hint domain-containing protein [Pseudorhodobacter aquimaris]|uniref:Hint domain-containing protein n=1 Tax=Pseudorhodobacter aquimaris TaxID=687412 RepID=UPI00067AFFA9|nr:Hint domain-containing protein [Pseudorhodobacter aquimaris]